MSAAGSSITVQCKCGKKLKAPASAVGKKAKCPGCGNALKIEAPPPQEDSLDALYELAETEQQAAKNQQSLTVNACPGCGATLAPEAVLCVICGYNTKTKKKLSIETGAAPAAATPSNQFGFRPSTQSAKGKAQDAMAPQGPFVSGLAMSAAFAVAAGLLWFLVAWGIDRDIYILSILVGVAAGVGMQLGQKGYSKLGGFAAAGITLGVIVIARIAVIYVVLSSGGDDDEMADGSEFDDTVVAMLTEENLRGSLGERADDATDDQEIAAHNQAVEKLKKMPKAEYDQLLAKAREKDQKDELIENYIEEISDQRKLAEPSNFKEMIAMRKALHAEAKAKVDALTPAQVAAETKRFEEIEKKAIADAEAQAAREEAEEAANPSKKDKDDGVGGAAVIGFVVIFFLLFGIWSLIATIASMAIAYKTAAGSVSG